MNSRTALFQKPRTCAGGLLEVLLEDSPRAWLFMWGCLHFPGIPIGTWTLWVGYYKLSRKVSDNYGSAGLAAALSLPSWDRVRLCQMLLQIHTVLNNCQYYGPILPHLSIVSLYLNNVGLPTTWSCCGPGFLALPRAWAMRAALLGGVAISPGVHQRMAQ